MPHSIPPPLSLRSPARHWALRDTFAAAGLFAATAAVVLWQNAHVAVLFDLSYILNTAERIALGQMPYRDFPLVHAPLTFLLQAAIIRITGRVFFHHVLYVAVTGGLGTVLAWRIALALLRGRVTAAFALALLLAAPLIFLGIYSIVPNPEYDCDGGFWLLVSLWMLEQLDRRKSPAFAFAAGALACVPMFFKQNMGLPFLLAALGAVLILLVLKAVPRLHAPDEAPPARSLLAFLAGACTALLGALFALHLSAGLGNYLHWTIQYAGQRRMPGLGLMLGVYRDPTLAWTLPSVAVALLLLWAAHPTSGFIAPKAASKRLWTRIAAFALLAAPFLFTLGSLLLYDDADERGDSLLALWPLLLVLGAALALANLFALRRRPCLRAFLPLLLLAAIHGTFLSQQLWGSTYGIWPLLILLLAELLAFLGPFSARAPASPWFVPGLAALISITMLVCGAFYTVSEERLSYANLPGGPPSHSSFPALAALAAPGPYLPEIDELLRFAQASIPFEDGIVLIPGEEPFYFATGRAPQFPVPLFDPTIDPYAPAQIATLARAHNIRWLIVKRNLQLKEDPTPQRDATLNLLQSQFTLFTRLRGYDIYRRP
jgi:hypothetical protein